MSLISGLVNGFLGSSAAKSSAGALETGAAQAEGSINTGAASASTAQNNATATATTNAAPYTTLGAQSANSLSSLLSPGGQLSQNFGSFSAPTAADAAATPGYQFEQQQALGALTNSAAARGGLFSGNTAQATAQLASNLASTNYQQAYNNALSTYGTNFNTFNSNNNNLYSRLFGTSQLGSGQTQSINSLGQAGAQNLSGIDQQQAARTRTKGNHRA